jgi:hypothetical protein
MTQFLIVAGFLPGKPINANSCNNQLHISTGILGFRSSNIRAKKARETEEKCNINIVPNKFSRGKQCFKAEDSDTEPD